MKAMADDLACAQLRLGDHIAKLTANRHPAADFTRALVYCGDDEIKVVPEWRQ